MSYQVLARKWRPQHFRDMIGQEHVLRALVNALDSGRLHHAYLFTGMRGVGKTTIARIFAKCLNCLERGVSADPCGQCETCRDIEAGRFLDLIEVDAASRTKVDETRELLENVPYLPTQGRFKVYLIDEVHMFSTHSFNALLKTLEEPPEHVKFLLATTDPQKVPVTVLSRCLQFNLRRMPPRRLADHLARVLDDEAIAAEPTALDLIARAADGSVRDALSLVEQATALGGDGVRLEDVQAMLGRVSPGHLLDLLESLAARDAATLFARLDGLASYAPDFGELLGEFMSLVHRVAMRATLGAAEDDDPLDGRIGELAGRTDAVDLQLFHQIGLHTLRDLPYAPDARDALDMALLRMLAFVPDGDEVVEQPSRSAVASPASATRAVSHEPALAAREAGAEHPNARPAAARPQADIEPPAAAATSAAAAATESAAAGEPAAATESTSATRSVAAPEPGSAPRSTSAPAAGPASRSAPAAPASTPTSSVVLSSENWADFVRGLGLAAMPAQLADNTVLLSVDDAVLRLGIASGLEHLQSPRFVERLAQAVAERTGQTRRLELVQQEAVSGTRAERDAAEAAASLEAARTAIDEDPLVRRLVDGVDGRVDPDSIRPRVHDKRQ